MIGTQEIPAAATANLITVTAVTGGLHLPALPPPGDHMDLKFVLQEVQF